MEQNQLKVGSIINVQAYKYNGQLYRQWSGLKVIENSPEHIVLHMYKTRVTEKNDQHWAIRELTIWFLPKNKMFNAVVSVRNNNPYVYVNLSSSFIFEDNTLKYIDYDLDIKCYPGKDFKVIDKNDFKKNRIKMKYSTQLIARVYSNVKYLFNLYVDDEYFFNKNYLKTFIEELSTSNNQKKQFKK